jgi:hypothetical protein
MEVLTTLTVPLLTTRRALKFPSPAAADGLATQVFVGPYTGARLRVLTRPPPSVALTARRTPGAAATVATNEPSALTLTDAEEAPVSVLVMRTVSGAMPVIDSMPPATVDAVSVGVIFISVSSNIGGRATLATAVRPTSVTTYIAPRLRATSNAEPGVACAPTMTGTPRTSTMLTPLPPLAMASVSPATSMARAAPAG